METAFFPRGPSESPAIDELNLIKRAANYGYPIVSKRDFAGVLSLQREVAREIASGRANPHRAGG
jgi:glucose/arabinose dehydrogenase